MTGDPRWTVITGASSGIGAALARLCAARGRPLVLTARRGDRLEALRAEIAASAPDLPVRIVSLDLEEPDGAERLVAWLAGEGIATHTLVNNAGFGLRGRVATLPAAEQFAMVALNVVTLTKLCRLVLPDMIARKRGGIVNVASTAAFQPIPFLAVYGATKAYVLSLSEAMHEEARPHGVVVTALCPGPTATEFTIRADMEKSKLFERPMSAEDVARLGLDGHEAGRAIVVTGASNAFGTVAVRFAPRSWVRRIAGRLQG